MKLRRLFFVGLWLALAMRVAGAAPPTPSPTLAPAPTPTATATPAPTPGAPTLSVAQYRTRLQNARDAMVRLQKRPPVNATKILKSLTGDVTVKRSDGATQLVHGDEWSERLAGTRGSGSNASSLTGHDARALRQAIETQIQTLDAWASPQDGAFYQPADAQSIVAGLEASGQIRTGPLWWQSQTAKVSKWFGDTIEAFFKWLGNLFKPRMPKVAPRVPNMSWNWLWPVFWAIVVALLGIILYFVYRALGGTFNFPAWWGVGRRKRGQSAEFEGEDAALLLLPPDELRQRAVNFAAQENFREALRHRFIALLLHLDERGVWRYDIRRTNWEHIGALRREETRRPLVAPLSDLTQRFDRVRYGGADCSAGDWARFDNDVTALEAQVGARREPPRPSERNTNRDAGRVAEVAR